ncbi:DUF3363 domain-containing protein [uncultured Rhodospira sp.]|uniref:DUF3363 domain-containing protein n=1 Tax=uncultured Rhodospira sp. TaxID=1936189 RepID=UPI00345883AA
MVGMLSSLSLEQQVETGGTAWLGGDFATNASEATRKAGFGRDVPVARWHHTRWLLDQGWAGTRRSGSPSSATCLPPCAGAR